MENVFALSHILGVTKCEHRGLVWRGRSYSPSEPSHTVHGDAAAWLLSELGVEQLEPVVHDLVGGRSSVIEGPILASERRRRKIKLG